MLSGQLINMSSLILYPINIESAPNWVIRKSFEKYFSPFQEYDWVNIAAKQGLPKTQEDFLEILKEVRPDYCFMQLQNPINMDVPTIREMAKYTKIINWCGDVRQHKEWYDWFIEIGKEIHITLFSNETDVRILREAGVRADYLQVGFDNVWYRRMPSTTTPQIVFCANNYGNFQLSKYREIVATSLHNYFGPDVFRLYGNGWGHLKIVTAPCNNVEEALLYNNAKIGISVSNFQYDRYHSDRLLRIMGCGTLPMSHYFKRMEEDFTEGENIVVFNNTGDLITKCEYYLSHEDERKVIADNAYNLAHTKHTWDVRCEQLIEILKKL